MERTVCSSLSRRVLGLRDAPVRCLSISRRAWSTTACKNDAFSELEELSSLNAAPPDENASRSFDPVRTAKARKHRLPPSRYQYRSPKYDRGPLNPHQPPPPSDPHSREFVPGPFSTPSLEHTYHTTIAPDYMTLCYQHTPPGFRPLEKGPRLRPWLGDSPYYKNRQLRGPRGGDVLRLLRKPVTFRNIPMLERITVHAYLKGALLQGSSHVHVAGMVVQAITNQRVTTHQSRMNEANWGVVKGKTCAVTSELKGEDMYYFLSKLINVVMPRVKDYRGVRATTGDGSGNLSLGLDPDVVGTFPEIEVNYDSYPSKMIPGIYITVHTTASTDKDARLLLQSIGVPFYGKIKN